MLSPHQPIQSNPIERFNPYKHRKQEEFEIAEWIDFFAERYGWSLDEIMELPIPTFFALREAIKKRNDRERKEMERKR